MRNEKSPACRRQVSRTNLAQTLILNTYLGGYAIRNLLDGTRAISNDSAINASGAIGTKTPGRYIPAGQGFLVTADIGGIITFKNSQRVFHKEADGNSIFMRSTNNTPQQNTDTREKIRLIFESPGAYNRQLLVGVDRNGTDDFDYGYDAPLIEDNSEDMYWLINDQKYIIQTVNNFGLQQQLPLGVKTAADGSVNISIESLENIQADKDIFIFDSLLGIYHNLREADYNIALQAGEHHDRFALVFDVNSSLTNGQNELQTLSVSYINNSQSLVIKNPKNIQIDTVEMYNILGQEIFTNKQLSTKTKGVYKIKNLSTGAYIVKLKTFKGTVVKKVLIK